MQKFLYENVRQNTPEISDFHVTKNYIKNVDILKTKSFIYQALRKNHSALSLRWWTYGSMVGLWYPNRYHPGSNPANVEFQFSPLVREGSR